MSHDILTLFWCLFPINLIWEKRKESMLSAFVLVTELPSSEGTLISARYWIQVWEKHAISCVYDWQEARKVTTAQTCLKI